MANHRTPLAKARVSGRTTRDPARFAPRRLPAAPPLGPPPAWLNATARACWIEFSQELPWLNASHHGILGIACLLRGQMREGQAGMSRLSLLRQCLASLGATPTSPTFGGPDEDEDPDDSFFRRQ